MAEVISGLVSTIIPTYNRTTMLCEAVNSVLAQTYRPIEIIISDDGSNSDAIDTALALQSRHSEVTHVLLNRNQGAGPAREAGRQVAKGEYIQYLDSDDRLLPHKFEKQVKALSDNSQCGAAYGQISLFIDGQTPSLTPHKWSGRQIGSLFPLLLVDRWWNTDAPLLALETTKYWLSPLDNPPFSR